MAELEQQHSRLSELQTLFAASSEEDFEDVEDLGVLPLDEVKDLKVQLKNANGSMKLAKRNSSLGDWHAFKSEADRIEKKLAKHKALEGEAKALKVAIRSTEVKKDELVKQARLKISNDDARQVIVERLGESLFRGYRQYLRADQRSCIAAIENLWNKYATTAKQIETERDHAADKLQAFLEELGYE